ncbi:TBC1 domain family member 2B-like [Nerophis ophidion]|uniref:TBC1 domain family member 2B-like n=1 Tax=Nerophis ophidion TaxID=159077 RepID=UPI002AE0097D|nr:TBC1 domain family member 2B-like [Nerophis ophidion]
MHEEDDGESSPGPTSPLEASKPGDVVDAESAKEQTAKLCGFLSKLSGKGPLRGYKPRWFVYDPRKCYLYYFKSPQDALPLGHIEIGDACFSYDVEGEEGHFGISTAAKECLLKAPSKPMMHFWLQQLQQKRWEFSNSRGCGQRDSLSSPILAHPLCGLVGKDNDAFIFENLSNSMEKVRSDLTTETKTEGGGMAGIQSTRGTAASTNTRNLTLKNVGTEIRNSMSMLRRGRVCDSRRSVFYTGNSSADEWEMVEAQPINFPEPTPHPDTHRHSFGSAFDFVRNSSRPRRPLLRDMMGSAKFGRNAETHSVESSPVEFNGKSLELQLRLQSQQEELCRVQQEQTKLTEELASQKELVRLLQQTLRTSQGDRQPERRTVPPPDPSSTESDQVNCPMVTQEEVARLEALVQERDEQIQSLCGSPSLRALVFIFIFISNSQRCVDASRVDSNHE